MYKKVKAPIPDVKPYSKFPSNNPMKTGIAAHNPAQKAFTQGNGFFLRTNACLNVLEDAVLIETKGL